MADDGVCVTLRDGRKLAYAEYGRRRGSPAFYFHGTPGGLLEGRLLDEAARLQDVRLIAVDRPGYGSSDFKKTGGSWTGRRHCRSRRRAGDRSFWRRRPVGRGPARAGLCGGHAGTRDNGRDRERRRLAGSGSRRTWTRRESLHQGNARNDADLAWIAAMWTAFWAPHTPVDDATLDRPRRDERRDVREAFAEECARPSPRGRAMAQDPVLFSRPWGLRRVTW